MSIKVLSSKEQTRRRIRSKISGTAERPRLSVNISNKHIAAQLIDDATGTTLAYATTVKSTEKGNLTEKAVKIGEQIAELGTKKKIKRVIFDRGTRIYHGRLHALAEAARKKGLEF